MSSPKPATDMKPSNTSWLHSRSLAFSICECPWPMASTLAKRVVAPDLTRRETDVLGALSIGRSNKEIGTLFDISEATVKVHMTHILEKLRVSSRGEAISVATGRGLVRC